MRVLSICCILTLFTIRSMGQVPVYQEKHRPQFHFSPRANWMNDPNGMVYYKGEYHLFFQYYPDSTVWGPMHWGHAISKDMVHWKQLPIALYPDSLGYIFSGSVVVDEQNTSGLQTGTEKPLVALFTYHDIHGEKAGRNNFQSQGLAYSLDKGATWKKFKQNPVIHNPGTKDFRDPKVRWHKESGSWIMTLAAGDEILFYRSHNLKDWKFSGSFGKEEGNHGGVWECPDLIELPMQNDKEKKWVLLVSIGNGAPNGGSGTQYFIGDFDGKTFHNSHSKTTQLWLDYGTDNYAGVTWSNAPDNRVVFLGWMSNWQYAQSVPTKNWRSAMTLPRELSLKQTREGVRLISEPVSSLHTLRKTEHKLSERDMKGYPISLGELSIAFDLTNNNNSDFGIELYNKIGEWVRVGYEKSSNRFYIDRTKSGETAFSKSFPAKHYAPRISSSDTLSLRLFIDHSSIELFADGGSISMTDLFFPTQNFNRFRLFGGKGKLTPLHPLLYDLDSIWK